MSGARSHFAGHAAEDIVARHYEALGMAEAARNWRGQGGEIDLIFRDGAALIFVEVKSSKSRAQAAAALRPAQIARITAAAEEFVASEPNGALTDMRFDLATVSGSGEVAILENFLTA